LSANICVWQNHYLNQSDIKIEGKVINGFTTVNLLIIIIGGTILLSLGAIED